MRRYPEPGFPGIMLWRGTPSLAVLQITGMEVLFLGCSETSAICGDIWKGCGVGASTLTKATCIFQSYSRVATVIMTETKTLR